MNKEIQKQDLQKILAGNRSRQTRNGTVKIRNETNNEDYTANKNFQFVENTKPS